jgi:hypothetical protein
VHLELGAAAIHHPRDDDVSLLQPLNSSRQNIARAQSAWFFRCQQQIASTNAHAQARSDLCSNQRCF